MKMYMRILLIVSVSLVMIILPIAWLISEFKVKNRMVRCVLGIIAILWSFAVAWLFAQFSRFNYNAWYGSASMMLIDTTIKKLEAGDSQTVLKEFLILNKPVNLFSFSHSSFFEIQNLPIGLRISKKPSQQKRAPNIIATVAQMFMNFTFFMK